MDDLIQIYKITDSNEIVKVFNDQNYTTSFGCKPQHLHYFVETSHDNEVPLLAINCKKYNNRIGQSYEFQLRTFKINEDGGKNVIESELISSIPFSRKIISVIYQRSIVPSISFHIVILSNLNVTQDSLLYLFNVT